MIKELKKALEYLYLNIQCILDPKIKAGGGSGLAGIG
jgi:hypothetical protein